MKGMPIASAQWSFSDLISREPSEEEIMRVIKELALGGAFSADDVVAAFEENFDPRATVKHLKRAVKEGWIEYKRCSCGEECSTIESRRESNNGRRILLYKSL